MIKPLVTVYITTHNRRDRLERALNSVLNQTYTNIEIIISDDASTDGTQDFCREIILKRENIKYFRSEDNRGACAARNAAINLASGLFITGLDDDDEFIKDRVEFFVKNWRDDYSFICDNFWDVYSDGTKKKHYRNSTSNLTYHELLYRNEASNQIFTKTEYIKSIGGFDTSVMRFQDWDTWLRMSYKLGQFRRFNKTSYYMYHDHHNKEKRVSKNVSIQKSYEDFFHRNNKIYDTNHKVIFETLLQQIKGDYYLLSAIKAFFLSKDIRFIGRYMFRRKFQ